jgi:hypothetical protein
MAMMPKVHSVGHTACRTSIEITTFTVEHLTKAGGHYHQYDCP